MRCRRSGQIWTVTTLQGKEKTRVMFFKPHRSELILKLLTTLNTKVEEKALLVINCAGNEGDSVEKMAGNVPKVSGNVSKEVEIFQR